MPAPPSQLRILTECISARRLLQLRPSKYQLMFLVTSPFRQFRPALVLSGNGLHSPPCLSQTEELSQLSCIGSTLAPVLGIIGGLQLGCF